jgi:hypothetical protein
MSGITLSLDFWVQPAFRRVIRAWRDLAASSLAFRVKLAIIGIKTGG